MESEKEIDYNAIYNSIKNEFKDCFKKSKQITNLPYN